MFNPTRSLAALALVLAVPFAACQVNVVDGNGYTKQEAAELNGVDPDGNDICAAEGWYNDNECDEFCPIFDQLDCPVSNECPDPTDSTVHYLAGPGDEMCSQERVWCADNQTFFHTEDCGCGCIDLPATCGGFAGVTCEPGFFCDYELQHMCGAADHLGTCKALTDNCPENEAPVCGCDGVTYFNDCDAHAHGAAILHLGPCEQQGASCGGIAGIACEAGYFCDYALGDGCGIDDGLGVCQEVPVVGCPEVYDPVCGCDGQTYGNECEAHSNGVAVGSLGECPSF